MSPLLREISYFENENGLKKQKINPIRQKYNIKNNHNSRVVSEIPKIDQTEFSQIGESKINMNQSNEKFKNSNILVRNKDLANIPTDLNSIRNSW